MIRVVKSKWPLLASRQLLPVQVYLFAFGAYIGATLDQPEADEVQV